MAIRKQITANNGVVTEYHRIAMVKIDINQQITILLHSYLSESGRQVEIDYAAGLYADVEEGMMKWPYVEARYLNCEYDETMNVQNAYIWLKTLPEFEGSEDV